MNSFQAGRARAGEAVSADPEQGRLWKQTAAARILELLQTYAGQWVELPAILKLGIAQYNTRIRELRAEGYVIENKTEWHGRVRKSWFMYKGKV